MSDVVQMLTLMPYQCDICGELRELVEQPYGFVCLHCLKDVGVSGD